MLLAGSKSTTTTVLTLKYKVLADASEFIVFIDCKFKRIKSQFVPQFCGKEELYLGDFVYDVVILVLPT